ncbi:S-adenosyl-L-methionine-dependent methyltransferase [Aspergillus cavernicola]|uniref:S-adenosyl-L-methionine-dependent methyltransferase n=1 Tax=Aspergillus cavernicola TaxID=176166 RepID=A0ABR4HZK8_9EURO
MADDYVLGRDLYGSIRLDAQHLLWKLYTGYLLHPEIPESPTMKIAEIGAGTGMWLLDLASQVPQGTQLHGYDLSDEQFPHESLWPSNTTFNKLDAFGEVPDHLVEQYDVVHLRMWCCIVKNNDTARLIGHAIRLLKPGGYIQWEDANLGKPMIRGTTAEEFGRVSSSIFTAVGFHYDWLDNLPEHIRQADLDIDIDIIHSELGEFPPSLVSLSTTTFLAGYVELFRATAGLRLQGLDVPDESGCRALLMDVLAAVRKGGAVYHWRPVTLLARRGATNM